jgi:Fe-S-cluster containining protein
MTQRTLVSLQHANPHSKPLSTFNPYWSWDLLPRCILPPWEDFSVLFSSHHTLDKIFHMVIIFMYVCILDYNCIHVCVLLTPPRVRVISSHLCKASKHKSMLCSQYAFSNHLLDEWTNELQNIFHLMPRKCSTWNGAMWCAMCSASLRCNRSKTINRQDGEQRWPEVTESHKTW